MGKTVCNEAVFAGFPNQSCLVKFPKVLYILFLATGFLVPCCNEVVLGPLPNGQCELARFPKEYYSQSNAAWVLNKVWRTARGMGYDNEFTNELGDPINDDHIYMMHYAGIPTIDIIHLVGEDDRTSCFFPYWHTINDNLQHIDKNTLQIVGNVVTNVIYSE